MTPTLRRIATAMLAAPLLAVPLLVATAPAAIAQSSSGSPSSSLTYADLADMADSATLVVRARVKKLARVEDGRAGGLRPGFGRFYVVGETRALLTGNSPIGQSFAYLVDCPLDRRGKPMLRKKDEVVLFARPVADRPGELQLVRPGAQILWDEGTEARVRSIVTAKLAPDAPAHVTGVREIIHVPGNLAGEGETQIFLTTRDSSAASITVHHAPGALPVWGVSFSELVGDVGRPPQRDTLEWYRLACFLPPAPPPGSNLSEGVEAQRMADADYRMVIASLGPCRRTL